PHPAPGASLARAGFALANALAQLLDLHVELLSQRARRYLSKRQCNWVGRRWSRITRSGALAQLSVRAQSVMRSESLL
ncbi:MAG: hypothetical protein ACRDL1_03415, partial [Solirubrobacterales bacterium]